MSYTKEIIKNLPYFFKAHEENNTTTFKLLDIIGKEFDYTASLLDYAYRQKHLMTMDSMYPYYVYKAILPVFIDINNIKTIKSNSITLTASTNISSFFQISQNAEYIVNSVTEDTYYIDTDKCILYVKKPYDTDPNYKDGKITIILTDDTSYTFSLNYHHVWNQFDEVGYLLSTPRFYKEDNETYRKRLLDVFKNPGSSTKEGLLNGIARELNLRKNLVWPDGSVDFIIDDTDINSNSIKVDGILIDDSKYYKNLSNLITIKGDISFAGKERTVSFVTCLFIHSLTDDNDIEFKNELYSEDGSVKSKLLEYKNKIEKVNPMSWNKIIWDESFWDNSKEEIGSLGALHTLFDAKTDGLF